MECGAERSCTESNMATCIRIWSCSAGPGGALQTVMAWHGSDRCILTCHVMCVLVRCVHYHLHCIHHFCNVSSLFLSYLSLVHHVLLWIRPRILIQSTVPARTSRDAKIEDMASHAAHHITRHHITSRDMTCMT